MSIFLYLTISILTFFAIASIWRRFGEPWRDVYDGTIEYVSMGLACICGGLGWPITLIFGAGWFIAYSIGKYVAK